MKTTRNHYMGATIIFFLCYLLLIVNTMKTIFLGQNYCIEAKLTYNKRLLIDVFLLPVVGRPHPNRAFLLFGLFQVLHSSNNILC